MFERRLVSANTLMYKLVPTELVRTNKFPHLRRSSPPRGFAGGTSWLPQAARAGGIAAGPLVPFAAAAAA